jgi:hypothetical protein
LSFNCRRVIHAIEAKAINSFSFLWHQRSWQLSQRIYHWQTLLL